MSLNKTSCRQRMSASFIAALALAALAGCGGGGGGGGGGGSAPVTPPAAAPQATLSVSSLTFGSTTVGSTSAPQTVTLTNTGSATLTLSSIASSDAAFKVAAGGTCAASGTVVAQGSCTVAIAFNPTVAGAASATLTLAPITSVVSLSGTGSGSAINTTRPVATYATGSPESLAFELLNDERGACGFGYLKQSAPLDQAAADANTYLDNRAAESLSAALSYSHYEDPAKSGFTGASPSDRAAYRNYGGAAVDVYEDNASRYYSGSLQSTNAALAKLEMIQLLTSVYHLSGLMSSVTDVGFAFTRVTTIDGYDFARTNMVSGVGVGASKQVGSSIRTYPCNGTTQVAGTFQPSQESPNPAPDLGTASIGTPVYINAPEGQTLTVTSATITPAAGGAAIGNRVLDFNHDPAFTSSNIHYIRINEAFILPLAPLTTGTAYTVTVVGTNNGAAFTTTFSFTPSL